MSRADVIRARAEADAAAASAEVERRAREHTLNLAAERERAAWNAERERADRARRADRDKERDARRARRRTGRAARVRLVGRAVPWLALHLVQVLPIAAPMAVAWVGQIGFAEHVLGWPLLGGVVFAAAWESVAAYCAWLYKQAREMGDRGTVYRVATGAAALGAGAMNYWHQSPDWSPTPVAVSYGAMSLVGITVWELHSSLHHRRAAREAGLRPPARPSFGVARWLRYFPSTWRAWSVAIRDDITTAREALEVAAAEVAARPRAGRRGRRRHAVRVLASRDEEPAAEAAEDAHDAAVEAPATDTPELPAAVDHGHDGEPPTGTPADARDVDLEPPASTAREHQPQAPTGTPDDTPAGTDDADREPPATPVRERPRKTPAKKPKRKPASTGRPLRADYLAVAREALTPDTEITTKWVGDTTGCSRTTAISIAAQLREEATSGARVLPLTR